MARLSKRSTRKSKKPSKRTQRRRAPATRSKRRKTRRTVPRRGGAEWIDKSFVDPYALPGHQVKTYNGTAPTGMCRNASGQVYSCPELDPTNRF